MSASDKKKLRKEQNAAAITERQKKERSETKKLKAYTFTFIVLMVLVVAIFLGITLRTPVTGLFNRATTAVKINDHKISTVELNYYYKDYIQNFANQYSDYGSYASTYLQLYTGLNTTVALDEQTNPTTGQTWAEFFIDSAKSNAQWAYAMYDKAMADGYKLTDVDEQSLATQESNLELIASYYNYSNANAYLRANYGPGSTVKSYMEYTRINTIANNYASEYYNGLEFEDSDYREYEKEKFTDYSSYSFTYYYVTVSAYQTYNGGGTEVKGDDGKTTITYTDEQKEAARKDAEKAANSLVIAENADIEKLNAAIKALPINKDKKDVAANENKLVLSSSIANADFKKWITDSARKAGDMTVIASKSGTEDNETVNGYYFLLFQEANDNKQPLANVQHILVKFSGGTKDKETGETTYSDEEKKAAKEKAEAILEEFKKGEKQDSEAFGKLAETKSEDTGSKSTGGLIEDIYRDSNYVQSFKDWALDNRKVGDTGVIESEYGYHVMFYKEDDELTYRDYMIDIDLTNETYTEWENSITAHYTITDKNLKGLDRDMVISG